MASRQETEATQLVVEDDAEESCCLKCPEFLHIAHRLLRYKAQYFFFYGALGSILPFLAVYFKQLGMDPLQIGILHGIKPFFGFIAAPVWGAIADKFRIRKFVLLLSIVTWMAAFLFIAHLAPPRFSKECPPGLVTVNMTNWAESPLESELVHGYKDVIDWLFVPGDVSQLFVAVVICVIIGECFWSPIGALGDVALISELGNVEMQKYSQQRSWGAFGMAVAQLATGVILQTTITYHFACGLDIAFTNYRVAFYIFTGAMVITFIISSTFKFTYKEKKGNARTLQAVTSHTGVTQSETSGVNPSSCGDITMTSSDLTMSSSESGVDVAEDQFSLRKLARLLFSVHYMSWLFCVFYMGCCNGIILGFLFWYLEVLGGDTLVMGVAGGLASGTEFVFFYIAPQFVRRVGPINTLYITLIMYAVRFLNYAVMVNPWLVLPSEILQGFTFATGWAALVQHATEAAPGTSLSSVMGMLHGVYWGLGIGTGHLVGGAMIDIIGGKATFQIFIGVTLGFTGFFFLAQKLSARPVYESTEKEDLIQ